MVKQKTGLFTEIVDGKEHLVAYNVMALTGWITAIELPALSSFGGVAKLRYLYIGLTAIGVLLLTGSLFFFANGVVRRLGLLNQGLHEIAEGNLRMDPLEVDSTDEFGEMATEFNRMKENVGIEGRVRDIVSKMLQMSSGQLARYHAIAKNLLGI